MFDRAGNIAGSFLPYSRSSHGRKVAHIHSFDFPLPLGCRPSGGGGGLVLRGGCFSKVRLLLFTMAAARSSVTCCTDGSPRTLRIAEANSSSTVSLRIVSTNEPTLPIRTEKSRG